MPTIVLTGATSGLGRIAAVELARRGAHLVLPARDPAKAAATQEHIASAVPGASTETVIADLSRIDEVRDLARAIRQTHPVVDVLVNNAGLHAFAARATADGLPEMVAVNYLAPWLLTNELLPALLAAPAGRVVTVASEASRRHGSLSLPDDLTRVVPFTARESAEHYGKSKLLDIMFTRELARRLEGSTVTATCLDPGFNVTGLGREIRGAAVLERALRALRIGDPRRGAGLIVLLATGTGAVTESGSYWTVRGPRRIAPVAPADDDRLRRALWEETERLVTR
jgi:NAD(P)-dependent dehydrogenase (short-subunit alcohol dehydrogenase family)